MTDPTTSPRPSLRAGAERARDAALASVRAIGVPLGAIFWGAWLLASLASPRWAHFHRSHAFRFIALVPEWLWGLAAVACGAVQLVAFARAARAWFWRGALGVAVVWLLFALGMALADPTSLGVWSYATLAVVSGLTAFGSSRADA